MQSELVIIRLIFLNAGDPIYPNFFKISDEVVHTGTSNVPIAGRWVRADKTEEDCDPGIPTSLLGNKWTCP